MLAPILSVGNPDISMADASWIDTYAGFQIPVPQDAANWKFFSQFVSDPFPGGSDRLGRYVHVESPHARL